MFAETISPEILQLTIERAELAKHRREIAEAVTSIGDRITSSRDVIAASHAIIARADRLLDAEVLRRLALERLDLGPEDETGRVERAREGFLKLGDQRRVLRLDVNVGDRHQRRGW